MTNEALSFIRAFRVEQYNIKCIEKRAWESRIQVVLDTKSYFYANAMLIAKNVRFSLELTNAMTKQPPNFITFKLPRSHSHSHSHTEKGHFE
jgi:hypothetical protein